jgi:hypothetical protein
LPLPGGSVLKSCLVDAQYIKALKAEKIQNGNRNQDWEPQAQELRSDIMEEQIQIDNEQREVMRWQRRP